MKDMKFAGLAVFVFLLAGCQSGEADIKYIAAESFHQAIALEGLPAFSELTHNSDTILVFPCKALSSNEYDKNLAEALPFHTDKYILKPVNETYITDTTKPMFSYVRIKMTLEDNDYKVSLIADYAGKGLDKIIIMDRAYIYLVFKNNNIAELKERWSGWQ